MARSDEAGGHCPPYYTGKLKTLVNYFRQTLMRVAIQKNFTHNFNLADVLQNITGLDDPKMHAFQCH